MMNKLKKINYKINQLYQQGGKMLRTDSLLKNLLLNFWLKKS